MKAPDHPKLTEPSGFLMGCMQFMLQQQEANTMITVYALISYGPKPKGQLGNHPGYRQQRANLYGCITNKAPDEEIVGYYDYARSFRSLDDLPQLKKLLNVMNEVDSALLIDDFRRLFAHCEKDFQLSFWEELKAYPGRLRDIRTGQDLDKLSHNQALLILSSTKPIKFVYAPTPRAPRSKDDLQDQTAMAVKASQLSRKTAADDLAQQLYALKQNLLKTRQTVTYQALADHANDTGLRTNHRKPWTAAKVGNMLRRHETLVSGTAE